MQGGFNSNMFVKSPPTELTQNTPDESDSERTVSYKSRPRAKKEKRAHSRAKKEKCPVTLTANAKKMLKRKLKINLASNKGY